MRHLLPVAATALALTVATALVTPPLIAAGTQPSEGQSTLYGGIGRGGSDARRGELIIIDQTSGGGAPIGGGAQDPNAGLTGLAFSTAGELFASTINSAVFGGSPVSTLIRLDPETGEQVASVGTMRLADGTPVVINDLALQPGTDVLFGTALNLATATVTNDLYTIDKVTGIATFVGNTGIIGATLAFGPDGTLYQTSAEFDASGFVRGFLHTLDPDTGAVLTTTGPFTEAHIGGLAVRPTDGTIFASGGAQGDIYILSAAGELTFLGFTGLGGVGDIAFTPLPTNANRCKNDGWQDFAFPRSFKNQGDCIQFVNTGK